MAREPGRDAAADVADDGRDLGRAELDDHLPDPGRAARRVHEPGATRRPHRRLRLRRPRSQAPKLADPSSSICGGTCVRRGSCEPATYSGHTRPRSRREHHRGRRRAGDPRLPRQPDRGGRGRADVGRPGPGGRSERREHRRARGRRAARRRRPLRRQGCAARGRPRQRRDPRRGHRSRRRRSAHARRRNSSQLDGTDNKSRLGANAILGVSLGRREGSRRRSAACRCTATSAARTRTCCPSR